MHAVRIQRSVTRTLFRRSRDIVDSAHARKCLLNSARHEMAQTSEQHNPGIYYLCVNFFTHVNNPEGKGGPTKYRWLLVDSPRLSELCLSEVLSNCNTASYNPADKLCCDTYCHLAYKQLWPVNPKFDAFNVECNIQRCNF